MKEWNQSIKIAFTLAWRTFLFFYAILLLAYPVLIYTAIVNHIAVWQTISAGVGILITVLWFIFSKDKKKFIKDFWGSYEK